MIQELDAKKMEVLEEIARINVLISEGKATLIQLEKDKEAFIKAREVEVTDRIYTLLNGSKDLLRKVQSNYDEVHAFYQVVKQFSASLTELQQGFKEVIEDFNQKSALQDEKIKGKEEELAEQRKLVELQTEAINKDKKAMEKEMAYINTEKGHIASQQRILKVGLELLKNGQ